jgi:hypothetical protein
VDQGGAGGAGDQGRGAGGARDQGGSPVVLRFFFSEAVFFQTKSVDRSGLFDVQNGFMTYQTITSDPRIIYRDICSNPSLPVQLSPCKVSHFLDTNMIELVKSFHTVKCRLIMMYCYLNLVTAYDSISLLQISPFASVLRIS